MFDEAISQNNILPTLLERDKFVQKAIDSIITCRQCHQCCVRSSAFVLSHEIETMRNLQVPMRVIGGMHFLGFSKEGRCANLTDDNECRIYGQRPTSCRLFPYYIINRPGLRRHWVIYDFCPDESKKRVDGQIRLNLAELKMVVAKLERLYSPSELKEMLDADDVIASWDRLEVGFKAYVPVLGVGVGNA